MIKKMVYAVSVFLFIIALGGCDNSKPNTSSELKTAQNAKISQKTEVSKKSKTTEKSEWGLKEFEILLKEQGKSPEEIEQVMKWLKELTEKGRIEENGATMLMVASSIGNPKLVKYVLSTGADVNGKTTFGGCSGAIVRPMGLRCVAQIRQASALPILGQGGLQIGKMPFNICL